MKKEENYLILILSALADLYFIGDDDDKKILKYFRPTYTYNFWGKKVYWTLRDRPLTEVELEEILDTANI